MTTITGRIQQLNITDNTLKLTIKNKEKVLVYYYLKDLTIYNQLELGDTVKITGKFISPKENTTKNLFNYKKYLYNKNIFYQVQASKLTLIKKNDNIFYKLKQSIKNKASSSPYLSAFILGDKSYLSQKVLTSYQENGISHLLAISGMHISLLSSILLKILQKLKVKETIRYFLTAIFLIFYLSLLDLTPSALRGVLFFILFSINKIYYFYIKPYNIFILVLSITLLINPFFIFDIGFQYSFVISLALLLTVSLITGSYLSKLLKTSCIAFIVSLPISLYNYYQINILSVIYNLFYVPLVSFIVFPLSLLTIIFTPILPIYNTSTSILEKSSLLLTKVTLGKLIFPKLNIIFYLIYSILIIILLLKIRTPTKPLITLSLVLLIHFHYPTFTNTSYIKMIDVGQGDSLLLHSNNESILIDTGGSIFGSKNTSKIATTTIIPLLKSLGIRKLKYLILTHGDADHMQEATFLLENFSVDQIIINPGYTNYLEKELLSNYSNISKSKPNQVLTCGDITLQQLNTDLNEENDSSQVYYGSYKDLRLLLTGDASIKSEQYLLDNYNLGHIDILKVGHHGSKTSTSKALLEEITPTISLISVGRDNKFSHPHQEVLNRLETYNSTYFQTSISGTITINLNTKKLTTDVSS